MNDKKGLKEFIAGNWLVLLLAAQPLLDILVFWNQNAVATIGGYIRLVIMMLFPLYLLITLKKKKRFLISMAVVGVFCALHILNSLRVGYMDPVYDIAYLARTVHMPVMAICLLYLVRDEQTKKQFMDGIIAAAVITLLAFAAANISGTGTYTYSEGIGLSGWVIEDNRCANSIIFVTLAVFTAYFAAESEKWVVNAGVPAVITCILIVNGTKACYFGLFVIYIAYTIFLVLEKPVLGKSVRKRSVVVMVLLILIAAAVYPVSPRAKMSALLANSSASRQGEIEATVAALGYDLDAMTMEEKLNTPEVRAVFEHYYTVYMDEAIPDLFDRFGYEPVLRYFKMSTDVARLIDVRQIKRCYSHLVWQQSDSLTKLVGYEFTNVGYARKDLENDWPALFYYYGYIGLALYAGFVLYFIALVMKRLIRDFKGSFRLLNFALFICLILQIGLAEFSGEMLRRPNVSIYMAAVLALIYYQTHISGDEAALEEKNA